MRYHVGSGFEEPPEHRLDREGANRILVAFDVIRTGMFRHCRVPRRRPAVHDGAKRPASAAPVEQAAPPSRNYREVLRVLLRYAVRFGRVFPQLATIAREACVSVRTVQHALDWLQRFGFVGRMRRLVRERGRLGGERSRQTSNAYPVGFPTGIGRLAQSVFRRIAYATGSPG
jgi:helix-turn-helix protein